MTQLNVSEIQLTAPDNTITFRQKYFSLQENLSPLDIYFLSRLFGRKDECFNSEGGLKPKRIIIKGTISVREKKQYIFNQDQVHLTEQLVI